MPWHDWADTIATLHMWTQVVGKIRMAQMPALNHWWESGMQSAVDGTPSLFIDGRRYRGPRDPASLGQALGPAPFRRR